MATATRTARRTALAKEEMFLWEGKDKTGKVMRGEMRATGASLVQSTLRRQGVLITKVKKQTFRRGGRITEKDIALFTRQLATMMKSGVPLLQAFDIVGKGAGNPAMGRLLMEIRNEVETGSSLSQAFRKYPAHFDPLYCNLVAAGEQAGILDSLLDRLATYKEKILSIKSKIKSAMFYPIAVMVVAVVVTTVIMLFVVPAVQAGVYQLRCRPSGTDPRGDRDIGLLRCLLVHYLRRPWRCGVRLRSRPETIGEAAHPRRSRRSQATRVRRNHSQGDDRALDANAVDHVFRRRAVWSRRSTQSAALREITSTSLPPNRSRRKSAPASA